MWWGFLCKWLNNLGQVLIFICLSSLSIKWITVLCHSSRELLWRLNTKSIDDAFSVTYLIYNQCGGLQKWPQILLIPKTHFAMWVCSFSHQNIESVTFQFLPLKCGVYFFPCWICSWLCDLFDRIAANRNNTRRNL